MYPVRTERLKKCRIMVIMSYYLVCSVHGELSILKTWIAWSNPHYKSKTNHDCTRINHRRDIHIVSVV